MTYKTLQETQSEIFGFDSFRNGQQEVIQAAISGQDSCVFWATGRGKSLCFQMPAFHLNKTVLVVSPMISLMHDQVRHINYTLGEGIQEIAVALTSSETDREFERLQQLAFGGTVRVIYCSPERVSNSHFLQLLTEFNSNGHLALIAIDEAHCIGCFGHDFRPDYQKLSVFREHNQLKSVPIMALTATASLDQRKDIINLLNLRNPFISASTVDRPNLHLSCLQIAKKERMEYIISRITMYPKASMIIYSMTRKETDDISAQLKHALESNETTKNVHVDAYHAGMSPNERKRVHNEFLNDTVKIIVATTAFGMGIDKPDIRNIIHFGPPKSFEEYYQQIGRAGRDGLASSCHLLFTDSEFNNYNNDFYMGKLPEAAKTSANQSLNALKRYSHASVCHHNAIRAYFGEENRSSDALCGVCDVCDSNANGGGSLRDFSMESQIILKTVLTNSKIGVTALVNLIMKEINNIGSKATKFSKDICKSMFPLLVSAGLLEETVERFERAGGFKQSYTAYKVSKQGHDVLVSHSPVMLPVPRQIEILEQKETEKLNLRMMELIESGIDVALIPKNELEAGFGPVLNSYQHWIRALKVHRSGGREELASNLEMLLHQILDWRSITAKKFNLAPASVLSEHVARRIAFTQPTDMEALRASGVRIAGVESLCEIISAWSKKFKPTVSLVDEDVLISVPETFTAPRPKFHNSGVWEASWQRFEIGKEHPQAIAATQVSGKPIQVRTIGSHLTTALMSGKKISLRRMMKECEMQVSVKEWRQMEEGLIACNSKATDDALEVKPVVLAILGIDGEASSVDDKERMSVWYGKLRMFLNLCRAGVPVSLEAPCNVKRLADGSDDSKNTKRIKAEVEDEFGDIDDACFAVL